MALQEPREFLGHWGLEAQKDRDGVGQGHGFQVFNLDNARSVHAEVREGHRELRMTKGDEVALTGIGHSDPELQGPGTHQNSRLLLPSQTSSYSQLAGAFLRL